MVDVVPKDLDPFMLAFFPHGEFGRGGIGIVERTQRDGDQPVELAVDLVMDVGAALRAELEGDPVAAVGDKLGPFRLALDRSLVDRPARLHGEGAARALLAVEAMANRNAHRLAGRPSP